MDGNLVIWKTILTIKNGRNTFLRLAISDSDVNGMDILTAQINKWFETKYLL